MTFLLEQKFKTQAFFAMKYKHVFFDLDRTLWDFDTNSRTVLSDIFQKYSLQERGVDSHLSFIDVYQKINEICWVDYRKGVLDKESLRSIRFEKTLSHFKIEDIKLIEEIADDYVLHSPQQTGLIPYTLEVLQYLIEKKYQLHIITNGFEEVQHIKMDRCGLTSYFQKIITSEMAGAKKPDSLVFKYALSLSNARAEESIMVGDDLEADVIGAREIKMDQVYYNPLNKPHQEKVSYEIRNLQELMSIL